MKKEERMPNKREKYVLEESEKRCHTYTSILAFSDN